MKIDWSKTGPLYIPNELRKLILLLKWELLLVIFGIFCLDIAFIVDYVSFSTEYKTVLTEKSVIIAWVNELGFHSLESSTGLLLLVIAWLGLPMIIYFAYHKIVSFFEEVLASSLRWGIIHFAISFVGTVLLFLFAVLKPIEQTSYLIIVLLFSLALMAMLVLKGWILKKLKESSILWNQPIKKKPEKGNYLDKWIAINIKHIIKNFLFFFFFFFHVTMLFGWLSDGLSRKFNVIDLIPKDFPSVKGLNEIRDVFGGVGYLMLAVETNEADDERKLFEQKNKLKLIDEYRYIKDKYGNYVLDEAGKKKVKLYPRLDKDGNVAAVDEKALKRTYYVTKDEADDKEVEERWEAELTKTKIFVERLVKNLETLKEEVAWCDYKRDVDFMRDSSILFFDIGDLAVIYGRVIKKKRDVFFDKIGLKIDLADSKNVKGVKIDDIKAKYQGENDPVGETISIDNYYLSANNMFMVLVKPKQPSLEIKFSKNLINKVQKVIDQTKDELRKSGQLHPSIRVGLGGYYKRRPDATDLIEKDIELSSFFGLLFIIGVIALYFRKFQALILFGIPVIMGIVWTMGITYLRFGHVNILTGFVAVILMGLGVDFGIHFLSRYYEERQKGKSLGEALFLMLSKTGKATLVAVLTTLSAFFVLTFTDFKGFNEFGFIGVFGISMSYLAMFYVLPTFLVMANSLKPYSDNLKDLITKKVPKKHLFIAAAVIASLLLIINIYLIIAYYFERQLESLFFIPRYLIILPYLLLLISMIQLINWFEHKYDSIHFFERFFKKPKIITAIVVLFALGALFVSSEVYFEYNFRKLEGQNLPTYLIEDKISDKFELPLFPSVIIADNPKDEKELYDAMQELKKDNGKQSTINIVRSLNMYVPENQDEKMILVDEIKKVANEFIDKAEGDEFQDDVEAQKARKQLDKLKGEYLDQVDFVYFESIPMDLLRQFKSDNPQNSDKMLLQIFPKRHIADHGEQIKIHAKEIRQVRIKSHPDKEIYASGEHLFIADILMLIEKEVPTIVIAVFLLTLFFLYMDFRSIKGVLITFTPFFVGMIYLFGFMYLFDVQFNILNVVMFPVIIGIGIDSGVHLYHRYLEEGQGNTFTVLKSTGMAVTFASLTTVLGFGALLFAQHKALNPIGALAVLGIGGTYIIAMTLLPAILLLLEIKPKSKLPISGIKKKSSFLGL